MFLDFLLVSYLLVNSQKITTVNNSFYLYCVFQDLQTGMKIGLANERVGMYFLDESVPISSHSTGVSDTHLQWHLCLENLSLQKFQMVVPIESSFSVMCVKKASSCFL